MKSTPLLRRTSLPVAVLASLVLAVPLGTASADTLPSPAPTTAPAPSATPSTESIPEPTPPIPTPTDGTTPPTTEPTAPPAAQAGPALPPPRARLPLKRGHHGALVSLAQQRLAWLGYSIADSNLERDAFGKSTARAVKAFQVKFWLPATGVIDTRTWKALDRIGKLPTYCTQETSLCADKTQKILRYVVNGTVRLTLDARFGLPGMDTGEGPFRVYWKSRDHVSSAYNSWMPFALFFNGGEAIHYSPYFARDGYNGGSHGCIGVRNFEMAEWLFDRVPTGTRVYVYRS
jgi:hypothetical protein